MIRGLVQSRVPNDEQYACLTEVAVVQPQQRHLTHKQRRWERRVGGRALDAARSLSPRHFAEAVRLEELCCRDGGIIKIRIQNTLGPSPSHADSARSIRVIR